ncbi:rhomboid family intramembrane serine protease [Pseudomonas sp. 21C1]|uniref:rhomboid family intramembrane serine protease n=1 Tax=Pseudomonas TaxID=286 RepID=UPI00084A6CBA|nr:rhomboid family intramembrane serine protease [Pseudomonas sp. 21C1]
MVVAHLLNMLCGYSLNAFGLQPRSIHGLLGIVLSPFLHGSVGHLVSNAFPFAVLSALILTDGVGRYVAVSTVVVVIGGLLVWSFGRDANHIGASGWVFGLWAYLIAQAFYSRSFKRLFIALLVLSLYGGMIFGLLPRHGVSFESHLFGALAGWFAAWLMRPRADSEAGRAHL